MCGTVGDACREDDPLDYFTERGCVWHGRGVPPSHRIGAQSCPAGGHAGSQQGTVTSLNGLKVVVAFLQTAMSRGQTGRQVGRPQLPSTSSVPSGRQ